METRIIMCRSKLVYWRLNYFLWKNAVTLKHVGGSGLKMGIEGSTWWQRPILHSCDPTYSQRHPPLLHPPLPRTLVLQIAGGTLSGHYGPL